MKRAEKKDHLVAVAQRLFSEHGYHGVGVDQIIAEAGVAKTTLYRHFRSKDELIVAVLRKVDDETRNAMRKRADAEQDQSPLLATFDFLENWFQSGDFHGCPFLGAAKEYCDPGNPVHREAAMHKRLALAYFEELARREQFRDPKAVAAEINLLHEGATAVAHISRDGGPAREAKSIAARLLDRYERDQNNERAAHR